MDTPSGCCDDDHVKFARLATICVATCLVVVGCTSTSSPTASHTQESEAVPTSCGDKPGRDPASGFAEINATTSERSLFALVFGDYPAKAGGQTTKIAWRMTGTGPLVLEAVGPNGESLRPAFGPEPHVSSNWSRPGDEWGSGFDFPTAGCWTITASRQDVSANIAVLVTA